MSIRYLPTAVQRGSRFVRRAPLSLRYCCSRWSHDPFIQISPWSALPPRQDRWTSSSPPDTSEIAAVNHTSEYHAHAISNLFKTGGRDAGYKAEEILLKMEQAAKTSENMDPPSTLLYNQVISMYGRCCRGRDAERLLRHLEANKENIKAEPDLVSYNACIAAWGCSREKGATRRAESLLKELISHPSLQPDSQSFNAVITAYIRNDDLHRANNVLQQMLHLAEQPESGVKLDAITLSSVISMLVKSRKRGAARQAQAILERMEALYEAGDDKIKPDAITYSTVISALANSGEKDAADRAMQLLKHMEQLYHDRGDFGIKPDTVAFNSVLAAIANSGEKGSGEKAQSLLQLMHHRHEAGNADVRPNTVSYSTVMQAWKNSGDPNAADKAEALLRKMQDLYQEGDVFMEPNTVCFSTVISALAKKSTRPSAERAEKLLDEMHATGLESVQPNTVTYSSVVEAWAATGEAEAVQRVKNIVQKMEELAAAGNVEVAPNTITYNTWIKAVEKCPVEDKAEKALAILRTMQTLYDAGEVGVKPSVRTYNAVFQACAATTGNNEDKLKALKVVLEVFSELRSSDTGVRPDYYTYPAVLKACANLFTGDIKPIHGVFSCCCKDQMVDLMVLSHVRRVAPDYLEKRTGVPAKDLRLEHIPFRWSRKIRKKRRKGQR